eukprot:g25038.t1
MSKRSKLRIDVCGQDPRLEDEEEEKREKRSAGPRKTSSIEDRSVFAAGSLRGFGTQGRTCSLDAPEPSEKVLSTLHAGDSFGELSLLIGLDKQPTLAAAGQATFRAVEDTTLFVINRKIFKDIAGRDNGRRRFKDYCDLLDEVDCLTPLLRPGRTITELQRGNTFGERSLMRAKTTGQCISEVNVDAGPDGLSCLTFDGEIIYDVFRSLEGSDASLLPSAECDASEWEQIKSSRSFQKIQCTIDLASLKELCRLLAFFGGCVIAALEHLHERKIIYRDLKPENIMLDTRGYGKVCDMGLARFVVGKTNTQAGTPDYMAPEMIDPPHLHDNSADWWSLGVLIQEMLCQHLPFDDDELEDTGERLLAIRRSQEMRLNFPSACPVNGQAFTAKLLRKLPHRLGAQGGAPEVRKHYFFDGFDFPALHAQTMISLSVLTPSRTAQ